MKVLVSRRHEVVRRLVGVGVVLAIYAALTAGIYGRMAQPAASEAPRIEVVEAARAPSRDVTIRDGWFWVGGQRFFIASVGWDPVKPNKLP